MSINYDQALSQLAALRQSGNLNQITLRELISSLSIEASGSVTVLYSGSVDGQQTTEIAKLLAQDSTVRVIDKSDAARFLDLEKNTAFADALDDVFNGNKSLANEFLYGKEVGDLLVRQREPFGLPTTNICV